MRRRVQTDRSESGFFTGCDGMGWDAAVQYWKSLSFAEALRELLTEGADMAALKPTREEGAEVPSCKPEGRYCFRTCTNVINTVLAQKLVFRS
jgi:hypothetical protein